MAAHSSDPGLPVEERIGHFVKRCEQALIARKSQVLRTLDLTVPQYTALLVLADNPGLSGAQLARRCYVTPQTMAALLTNLEAKSLVNRRASTVHAQVMQTALTRHGRALLRKADRLAVAVETRLAEEFSDGDRKQLIQMLERAAQVLEARDVTR